MTPLALFFIVFGALLTVTGVALFAKMGTQGTSVVKMLGFEFQLGGSALVIFVVGVVLCLVPLLFPERFVDRNRSELPSTTDGSNRGTPTDASRTQPSAGEAMYILNTTGSIEFDRGSFSSVESCSAQVKSIGYPTAVACTSLPARLFCTLVPLTKSDLWDCFPKYDECSDVLALDALSQEANHLPAITEGCVPTTSKEALRRANELKAQNTRRKPA